MSRFNAVAVLLVSLAGAATTFAGPRVAVFDPQTGSYSSVYVAPQQMDEAAVALTGAGFDVSRLTADQVADTTAFDASRFDVLVMRGNVVPRGDISAIQRFCRAGGVLVGLTTGNPFRVGVARGPDGVWERSPDAMPYKWETNDIAGPIGLRYAYRPALNDGGVRHTATPLLKQYLPEAHDHVGRLASPWVVPAEGARVVPLVRSQRGDGRDVLPQVFVTRGRDGSTAVISLTDYWTGRPGAFWMQNADDWAMGARTVVAMVRVAADVRSGKLDLLRQDGVDVPVNLPAPEPLTTRVPTGQVDPEQAPVVARWGKFDGSGTELHGDPLPRVLTPGASVTLPLTQDGRPLWLRVRGAIGESSAGLCVRTGDVTLWNELLSYVDAGGPGNTNAEDLSGVPLEFTRRVFVPPIASESLTIQNSGDHPLYFDAVQLEHAPLRPVEWVTALGSPLSQAAQKESYNIPKALAAGWSAMRSPVRTQLAGPPGDPKRWDKFDALTNNYLKLGVPLDVVLEGTPQWAAISQERWNDVGLTYRRPAVPPQNDKYLDILTHYIQTFGDRIARYEVWNEANSQIYFIGSPAEYVSLWKSVVPLIRRLAPKAQVLTTGLAGWNDRFVGELIKGGVLAEADLFAFHPYSGTAAAWDKPFAEAQGNLYALGQPIEIYCNEMGFVHRPGGYPPAPYAYTPATQGRSTDVALARLLASGCAKWSVYMSGGDDGGFSVIDSHGKPRPAFDVLADYFPLAADGGTRLDVAMARTDGKPQGGVYVAAAQHRDGRITLVINPAETPDPHAPVPLTLRVPLPHAGRWSAATRDGRSVPMHVTETGGTATAEVSLEVTARTLLVFTH